MKENDSSTEVNLSAVKNEFESAQIVLRGDKNFKIEGVSFTDLKNGDHTISADNLKYNFVEYEWLDKNSAG